MYKRILFAGALLTAASVGTANAQGFFVGVAVGGMLFGGSNWGGSAATIVYTAKDETIKAVKPLSVRTAVRNACFDADYNRSESGLSFGDLFSEATKDLPKKERTILQIARVFDGQSPYCAAIWFSYTEN